MIKSISATWFFSARPSSNWPSVLTTQLLFIAVPNLIVSLASLQNKPNMLNCDDNNMVNNMCIAHLIYRVSQTECDLLWSSRLIWQICELGLKVGELGWGVQPQVSWCPQIRALFITAASLLCPGSEHCADWEHENNVCERLCCETVDSGYQNCPQRLRKKTKVLCLMRPKLARCWETKWVN